MSNTEDEPIKSTYTRPAGMASLFGQVDDVKNTMQQNMEKINERQHKLEQLEDTSLEMMGQAQNLASSSSSKSKNKKK